MLIEFSVSNFLSIRERQTLSLVSNYSPKDLPDNLIPLDLPGLRGLSLLKSAVLYGANASGKSNFLIAMAFVKSFIVNSATGQKPDEKIKRVPFRLDEASANAESEFEIVFVHKNVRYQYGFCVDDSRVKSEWLFSFPKGQQRVLFTRQYNEDSLEDEYKFGTHLREDRDLRQRTRSNALYLSVASQWAHEKLTEVYQWFKGHFLAIDLSLRGGRAHPDLAAKTYMDFPDVELWVAEFLQHADTGIEGFRIVKRDARRSAVITDQLPGPIRNSQQEYLKDQTEIGEFYEVLFDHRNEKEGFRNEFSFFEESAGTRRLFELLAPIKLALDVGTTLFVDEIEASVHPHLVRKVVSLFHSTRENSSNAQLIFATHDATLLRDGLMRRDQVWFVEKNNKGCTQLHPLTDYKPRKDESLMRGYLAGRYGGVPFMPSFVDE